MDFFPFLREQGRLDDVGPRPGVKPPAWPGVPRSAETAWTEGLEKRMRHAGHDLLGQ
jgi:hypothetical protein